MMNANPHAYSKIAFDLESDDDTREVETLWAVPVEGGYRIDNIPFYVRGIAYGDVVRASPDGDGQLCFEALVSPSGHSTVRLWFANGSDVRDVRDALRELGCGSELDMERLVAVDVPTEVRYTDVISFLDEKERLRVLEYEEGCIGHPRG
jgi:hypothetical protein